MLDFSIKPEKSKTLNYTTFLDYYNRLRLLALSMFEWTGLPDTISVRYLESVLYERGQIFFFRDNDYKPPYLALHGGSDSTLDVYGEPIQIRVSGGNGYQRELDRGEYVMIRNNYDMTPTDLTIRLYAQRLMVAERTIDVNINAQKTPVLIYCEEKQRYTLKQVYSQYEGNEPVIYSDKSFNPDSLRAISTLAPFIADKVMQYKRDLWNECMTFLGINNANTDKKERLVVPEVESNNDLVQMSAQVMLLCRQAAAEQINKMFGLNVSVKLRGQNEEMGVKDNEQVLDRAKTSAQ